MKIMALPKIGVNMTEATITQWKIKVGDVVKEGDAVCEAETDKSTQDIYATESGIVGKLFAQEGDTVECFKDLIVFLEEGEEYTEPVVEAPAAAPEPAADAPAPVPAPAPAAVPARKPGERIRISPLAKKTAKDMGIDYTLVAPASGGRIVKADILAFAQRKSEAPSPDENMEVIPMSATRKVIAKRMSESNLEKPVAALTIKVAAEPIMALREAYKKQGIKVSFDAVIAKFVAKALDEHRIINSTLEGENICIKRAINVGVAIDTKKGLMVPVIKDADKKSLLEVADEYSDLCAKTIDGRATSDMLSGSTFTVTNLGIFGIENFTAVINPPECCILALGRVDSVFVPDENGLPVLRKEFRMTLSFDHRIVDGAPAAKFLARVKQLLENPMLMI